MQNDEPKSPDTQPDPPPVEQPGIEYDWSQPPAPQGQHQGQDRPNDIVDHLIPAKNQPALLGYYFGCFSFVPCFTPFLGPAAIVSGVKGLRAIRENPGLPGKGHAITALVCGITALSLLVFLVVLFVVGMAGGR